MTDEPGTKQRRTRAALYAAVFELSAERDPTALTVTEVAERAGVHRSTVYEHATSPMDLLLKALLSELDELRGRYLSGLSPADLPAAIDRATLAAFAHVDRHAAIYRNVDEASGATVHALLGDHFVESSRILVREGLLDIPITDSALGAEVVREAALRYVADGVVGLISVWLATPEPRDPRAPLRLFHELRPRWWPGEQPEPQEALDAE